MLAPKSRRIIVAQSGAELASVSSDINSPMSLIHRLDVTTLVRVFTSSPPLLPPVKETDFSREAASTPGSKSSTTPPSTRRHMPGTLPKTAADAVRPFPYQEQQTWGGGGGGGDIPKHELSAGESLLHGLQAWPHQQPTFTGPGWSQHNVGPVATSTFDPNHLQWQQTPYQPEMGQQQRTFSRSTRVAGKSTFYTMAFNNGYDWPLACAGRY